jgi:nucleotide-binding universal stress UspA family protein
VFEQYSQAEEPSDRAPAPDGGGVETVVVATDGTGASPAAVARGVAFAQVHDAVVHALYVVDTGNSMGHFDPVVERAEAAGERAVEAAAERAERAGVTVEKAFRYGRPHEEIVEYAVAHDADMVVVGKRDSAGLRRFVGGPDTAQRVVRDAPVPVLVATDQATGTADSGAPTTAD